MLIFPGQDKGVYELFPELKNETAEDFFDFFVVDDLRELIVGCLDKFGKKLTEKDRKLCEIVCDMLINKGVLGPDAHNALTDELLIAAMLRDCEVDINKPSTLIRPRDVLFETNKELGSKVPEEELEKIAQCIEAQFGELTPIPLLKGTVGSFQQLFADACFVIDRYIEV